MNERHYIRYWAPAAGKFKRFVKNNGQWFKATNWGDATGKPLTECQLTKALDAQLDRELAALPKGLK